MKMSPVQLLNSALLKIYVEPDSDFTNTHTEDEYEFADIEIETAKSIAPATDFWNDTSHDFGDVESRTVQLSLGVRSSSGATAPYKFEVVCAGVFAILDSNYKGPIPWDHLVWQAGLTMLYGRIRELVSSTTLKMPDGELLLPTMSFMGETPPSEWQTLAQKEGVAIEGTSEVPLLPSSET